MKIAVAEPSSRVLRAVERALAESEHRIVWSTGSGHDAAKLCEAEPPDLLLLGLRITDTKPVELTRKLVAKRLCAIVLLSVE